MIIDRAESPGYCQEWQRGPLTGRIPHTPLPSARLGDEVEVSCLDCNTYLYTYREERK